MTAAENWQFHWDVICLQEAGDPTPGEERLERNRFVLIRVPAHPGARAPGFLVHKRHYGRVLDQEGRPRVAHVDIDLLGLGTRRFATADFPPRNAAGRTQARDLRGGEDPSEDTLTRQVLFCCEPSN